MKFYLTAVRALSLTVLLAAGSASAQGVKTKVVFIVTDGAEAPPTDAHVVATAVPVGAEAPVAVAPPAPKFEVVPASPSKEHVWVSGHWRWEPGTKAHVWVPGHWEKRRVGQVWVQAHWVSYGGKYHFVPGYWRNAGYSEPASVVSPTAPVGAEMAIETAPPPPKFENHPPSPGSDHVWANGHWRWDPGTKSHAWVPGHYEKQKPGHTWEHSHWVSHGGKYHFVPGYWRKN